MKPIVNISEIYFCFSNGLNKNRFIQYKIDKTIITFYIDPDTSEIIMVAMKTDCLIYYK